MLTIRTGDWYVEADGKAGYLTINALGPAGELYGTLFGDDIVGFWDDRAKKATFMRITNPHVGRYTQTYTGYLFPLDGDGLALTGSFQSFTGPRRSEPHVLYGWLAEWRPRSSREGDVRQAVILHGS